MEIAQAMSTALMAGTLLAGSEPLNGLAEIVRRSGFRDRERRETQIPPG
jgi:hypothetical protein